MAPRHGAVEILEARLPVGVASRPPAVFGDVQDALDTPKVGRLLLVQTEGSPVVV